MRASLSKHRLLKTNCRSLGLLFLVLSGVVGAESLEYSRPVESDVPRQVHWGDTHLHTRLSADAFSFGNSALGPDDAFRFARGATVTPHNGIKARLRRPLDLLAVTGHAEFLGVFAAVMDGDKALLSWAPAARLLELIKAGETGKVAEEFAGIRKSGAGTPPPVESATSIWRSVAERADRFNEPGRFTAIIGYEYTSMPNMANLHRNVIFRDGPSLAAQVVPFSAQDRSNPEGLWKYLDGYQKTSGRKVLAIPHNRNVSNGLRRGQVGAVSRDWPCLDFCK